VESEPNPQLARIYELLEDAGVELPELEVLCENLWLLEALVDYCKRSAPCPHCRSPKL
jgi:hypothetical protein